jgi:DNA (cytosine-5)-methyltransferase 1
VSRLRRPDIIRNRVLEPTRSIQITWRRCPDLVSFMSERTGPSILSSPINVIDLFAGPSGLGEGLASFKGPAPGKPKNAFEIACSIECDPHAHQTLQLRSMQRKLSSRNDRESFLEYLQHPEQLLRKDLQWELRHYYEAVREETLDGPKTLGTEDDRGIFKHLRKLERSAVGPTVVIGGPPCQAYSLVGRSRNLGKSGYKAESDHRTFLYQEYLKVLTTDIPEVFVMENVKGLLSSRLGKERIFPMILIERLVRLPQATCNWRTRSA